MHLLLKQASKKKPKIEFLIFAFFTACWSYDTHERPTFKHILKTLDDIARSKFQAMTGDNFYSMQDDWKVEIDEMLLEIRFREEVRRATFYCYDCVLLYVFFHPFSLSIFKN